MRKGGGPEPEVPCPREIQGEKRAFLSIFDLKSGGQVPPVPPPPVLTPLVNKTALIT